MSEKMTVLNEDEAKDRAVIKPMFAGTAYIGNPPGPLSYDCASCGLTLVSNVLLGSIPRNAAIRCGRCQTLNALPLSHYGN